MADEFLVEQLTNSDRLPVQFSFPAVFKNVCMLSRCACIHMHTHAHISMCVLFVTNIRLGFLLTVENMLKDYWF